MKTWKKVSVYSLLSGLFLFLAFLGSVLLLFRIPTVQTRAAQAAAAYLEEQLGTEVRIDRLYLNLWTRMVMEGVYLSDLNHDTLIYAGKLEAGFGKVALLQQKFAIEQIELSRTVVHLHRNVTGDTMNLTALFNRLLGPSDTSAKKSPSKWELDVRQLKLHDTEFGYRDDKTGLHLMVVVPELEMKLNDLGLEKKLIDVASAHIQQADVRIDIYPHPESPPDSLKPIHFLYNKLDIRWADVHLEKARFRMDNHTKPLIKGGMDYSHLLVEDIDLKVGKGGITSDTIFGKLNHLSAREKCGLVLQTLTADVKVSVNEVELKNMMLITESSQISDYLLLRYDHFRDFKNYVHAVKMEGHFQKSQVALKDINYFAKKLGGLSQLNVQLSGIITGTVDRLKGKAVVLKTGKETLLAGDLSARGLPNIKETFLNLRIQQLSSSYPDLKAMIPTLKIPATLNKLGVVRFRGNFDGFISDFVADGRFTSAIGAATTDLNFKYNDHPTRSNYKGNLELTGFDLGVLTGRENVLGKISLQAKLNGKGLTLASLKAGLEGKIESLELNRYTYREVTVNGVFSNKSFSGHMEASEKNLEFRFDGLADLSGALPRFEFSALVDQANLYALHFTKDSTEFSGLMEADFVGSSIDNLTGTAVLRDLKVRRGARNYALQAVSVKSTWVNDKYKKLELFTDNLSAEIGGNFRFTELPLAVKNYLAYTFTHNYSDTAGMLSQQEFMLNVTVKRPDTTLQLLEPKLKVLGNGSMSGYMNSSKNEFNLRMNLPFVEYAQARVEGISMNVKSGKGDFDGWMSVDNIKWNDSLMVDTIRLSSKSENNGFLFRLDLANRHFKDTAMLMASLHPYQDSASLHIDSSSVWLGGKQWRFDPNHRIGLGKEMADVKNLVFGTGEQSLTMNTYLEGDTALSLRVNSNELSLEDLTTMFGTKAGVLRGFLNGTLSIANLRSPQPRIYANITGRKLGFGNEEIGNMVLLSNLDESMRKINIQMSVNGEQNAMEVKGHYNLFAKDSGLEMTAKIKRLSLGFLNYPFFKTYVKDVKGSAHGLLQVHGPVNKLVVRGNVLIDSADVRVTFLNTRFKLDHEDVILSDGVIDVGNLSIFDEDQNILFGSGRILHDHFKNIRLDMAVNTRNAQMLNTTAKENPLYYGQVYAEGNVSFKGPVSNIVIRADAKTMPKTHFAIPINSSVDANKYSFYKFVDEALKDTLIKKVEKGLKLKGVTFVLQLEVTPDAVMDIILDPLSGDVLTSVGKGNLKLDIQQGGNISLLGEYQIVQGSYLFTLQNLINKKFELDKGGTITFSGPIYRAQLNASAVYEVRTSVYDLISDLLASSGSGGSGVAESERIARAKNRIPVKLLLNLKGVLERPDISFNIKPIDPDPTVKTMVDNKMQIIRNNESELNKQVFGLLVMNKFLPSNNPFTPTGGGQTNIGGSVANTVSEFVSNQLSQYVNNWLSNFVSGLDLNVGYRQYDAALQGTGASGGTDISQVTRRELQLALSKRFLNNRLTLNAGGNVDFGSSGNTTGSSGSGTGSGTNTQSTFFTGDFELLYALTKDRSLQAKAFNRTDWDNFNQRNRNKTGIGVSYQQDFDTIKELVEKARENRKNRKLKKEQKQKKAEEKPGE